MEIIIVNTDNSLIERKRECLMLWTSSIFADKINYGGVGVNIFDFKRFFESHREKEKWIFAKSLIDIVYRGHNMDMDIRKKEMDDFYNSLLQLRKKKGKQKDDVILCLRGEKLLKQEFSNMDKYFMGLRVGNNVEELTPFIGFEKGFIECFYLWGLKKDFVIADDIIYWLRETFEKTDGVLILDETIEKWRKSKSKRSGMGLYYEVEFLDFYDCKELRSSNLEYIRKNYTPLLSDIRRELVELKRESSMMEYNIENVTKCKEKYNSIFGMQREIIQNRLDELLTTKTNITKAYKKYPMHFCFTSFENMLSILCNLKILNEKEFIYAKDILSDKINLKNIIMFTYINLKA